MGVIYLVRHGQASFGEADYDVLSDLGHEQGRAAGDELRRRGVRDALLCCGSLRRQRDTAAAAVPDAEPVVDERWDEYDAEAILANYRPEVAFSSRPEQSVLEDVLRTWAGDTNGSEPSYAAFRGGVAAATRELTGRVGKGAAAVVCTSGGVIAAVLCDVLGLGVDGFLTFNRVVANASISTLTVGRSGVNLLAFNEHAHVLGSDRVALTYR